ncbi:MAG: PIG-L family deacetylase [Acidobacteriota bacterium]
MPGLVFAGAHPDDELYAAGLLACLAARGVDVHLLFLTRGEGGSTGKPPVAERENLGAAREAEARGSAAALGARSIGFLGYVDPLPQGRPLAPEVDPDDLARQIADALRRHGAEALLTHGTNGEYGHPAHRLMHEAGRRVQGTAFYTFNAAAPVPLWGGVNADDPADLVFDPEPWREAKARAFASHVSQRHIWLKPGGPATEAEFLRRSGFRETFRRHSSEDPLREWLSS